MIHSKTHRRRKRRAPWAAYLWPGLPHLWVRGSWAGLALAIAFTALLHTTVLATIVWPEWLSPRVVAGCGVTLGLLWLAALWETHGELRRQAAERESQAAADQADEQADQAVLIEDQEAGDDGEPATTPPTVDSDPLDALFNEAQTAYLQADWVATERLLLELLKEDNEDIEAHLLLATLWRRTERTRDARRRLRWLARREAAAPWEHEIRAETGHCDAVDAIAAASHNELAVGESAAGESDDGASARTDHARDQDHEPPPLPEETVQLADTAQPQPLGTDRRAA